MAGVMVEDAWMFIVGAFPNPVSIKEYEAYIGDIFHTSAPTVLKMYPPDTTTTDQRGVMSFAGTDFVFYCSARAMLQGLTKAGQAAYIYRFDQLVSVDIWEPTDSYCVGHVCHGSELTYLYHSWTYDNSGFVFTEEEQLLADTLTAYWINFAISGNPNTPPPPFPNADFINWPGYSSSDTLIAINASFGLLNGWHHEACDTFNTMGTIPYLYPW